MTGKHGVARRLGLALGLLLMAPTFVAGHVDAAPKAKAKKKKDAKAAEPATITAAPKLKPKGLRWQIDPKATMKVYYAAIDDDYNEKMMEVSPGIEMTRLQNEIQMKKDAFRLSLVQLTSPPSKLDSSNFVGEYTYKNKEAFMQISREGKTRTLFFIRDKLWKTIDVYKLGGSSKWGADFAAAVKRLEKLLGVEGRVLAADPDNGRPRAEVDWADATAHLRAADWGKELAIIMVNKDIESKVESWRTNKPGAKEEIDPSVKKVLR